jgi:hypothetical protein
MSTPGMLGIVSPNPTDDYLFLSKEVNPNNLKIVSIDGKQMNNWQIDGNRIEVTHLNSGVYMIQYMGSSTRFVRN